MIEGIADTHSVIWYIYADSRLSSGAKSFIDFAAHGGNQIGDSAITPVEMIYLIERGRIASESLSRLGAALDDSESVFSEVALDLNVARALACVDANQIPEMPDRIVAATAVLLNVPVISRDHRIQLSTIETIW